jgi:hypothetical protein
VIGVPEAATAPHGDEPWVTDLGKDHLPHRRSNRGAVGPDLLAAASE